MACSGFFESHEVDMKYRIAKAMEDFGKFCTFFHRVCLRSVLEPSELLW